MKTFSMFFSEDAGEKFNKMDDDQFANWKKANPGAAKKADQLRSAKKESGLQKNDAKKELPTSAITAPKGGALAKHRKSEMGKWAEGAKKSPKNLAAAAAKKAGGALAKKAGSALVKKASSAITKRDDIKNVDVKDVTPKKVEDEKQAIGKRSAPKSDMADKQRARINKNSAMVKGKKKHNKNRIGNALKGIGKMAKKARDLADLAGTSGGDQEEGGLQGNTQRTKGVLS